MGEIRSALDIALEKTANIESDKDSAGNRELQKKGKKAASTFLADGNASALQDLLTDKSLDHSRELSHGAISILLASLKLPAEKNDLQKVNRAGVGLDILLPESEILPLFNHVEMLFAQYLEERVKVEKALEQQFLPKLRAKQQEMAKRYGQSVPMELNQDSEYLAALSKNKRYLEQKYDAVIIEVRSRVREAAGMDD